jgi:hypothetical protein
MEKLKWIILIALIVILAGVIFMNSKEESEVKKENYAEIDISYPEITTREGKTILLMDGKYTLFLEEFQIIEGKGTGWHLRFSAPEKDREMILVFDAVDTTGHLFTDSFPQKFGYSTKQNSDAQKKQEQLYRGSFLVGYVRKLSDNQFQEDVVPMLDFTCIIDTAWVEDTIGGFRMSFSATHSDLLADVYGMRYLMRGTMNVDTAKVTKRILQHQ